jgi:hypothetical protein
MAFLCALRFLCASFFPKKSLMRPNEIRARSCVNGLNRVSQKKSAEKTESAEKELKTSLMTAKNPENLDASALMKTNNSPPL